MSLKQSEHSTLPIVQVVIRSQHNEVMTTWVDKRPGLKEGNIIRLKDFMPTEQWTITHLYDSVHDAKDFDWHRKWDNNI